MDMIWVYGNHLLWSIDRLSLVLSLQTKLSRIFKNIIQGYNGKDIYETVRFYTNDSLSKEYLNNFNKYNWDIYANEKMYCVNIIVSCSFGETLNKAKRVSWKPTRVSKTTKQIKNGTTDLRKKTSKKFLWKTYQMDIYWI